MTRLEVDVMVLLNGTLVQLDTSQYRSHSDTKKRLIA